MGGGRERQSAAPPARPEARQENRPARRIDEHVEGMSDVVLAERIRDGLH